MGEPGFGEPFVARFGIIDRIREARALKREKAQQARLDKIKSEGIVVGTKVLYQNNEWEVRWIISSGYLILSRVISGHGNRKVYTSHVDSFKVTAIR